MDDVLTRSAIALPLGIVPSSQGLVWLTKSPFSVLPVVFARRFCRLVGVASRQGCAPMIHGAQSKKSLDLSRYSNLRKLRYSAFQD